MQYYGQQKRSLFCPIAANRAMKRTSKAILRVLPPTFKSVFRHLMENTSLRGPVKPAKCTDTVVKCKNTHYFLQQHSATCNSLICCNTGLISEW